MPKVERFAKFYAEFPLFAGLPRWYILACLMEGFLFYPQLKKSRVDVFPVVNNGGGNAEPYLEHVPFTWTSCNNLNLTCAAPKLLYVYPEWNSRPRLKHASL